MTQQILGNQSVQIANVQSSTVTVSINATPHRAVPLEPAWLELRADVTSPARLLRARYGVVPYVPPGDLAERLTSWAHAPLAFALRVVAGTAGAGKTRIAIELCRSLSKLGWLTGLLRLKVEPEQLDLLADTPTARLVVVDYAETRQEQLAKVLPNLARQATAEHPVRALLTIRSRAADIEDVRRTLYGRGDAMDVVVDEAGVDLLSELPFGERERASLFAVAVEAISRRLKREPEAARRAAPDLADPALTTALMVLVAAYLAVADGHVPSTRTELLESMLRHEDRYWSGAAAEAGLDVEETLRGRVVALATLAGTGASESETAAAQLLRLVPDLSQTIEERRRALARWIHGLYLGAAWWNPVEPDLIGEHLVASTYGDQREVLSGVLTGRPPDALVQPLRLLARAARDHAELAGTLREVVTDHIADLCRTAIEQASGADAPRLLQAGTTVAAALEPLVALVPPDPNRLPPVLDGFPRFNTVLAQLAVTLTSQLAIHYRRLAAANPDAFEPDLASALNNLSVFLSNLGRREQALGATEAAVELYRRLAAGNPSAFEPDLASALNNFGTRLSNLGRREQALRATEEAVEIRRRLAAANPAAFEPDLAMSLNNLGAHLSHLGRREQALQATEEAVEIWRRLLDANPAAFEPDLAGALSNLGMGLSNLGRWEQALRATAESVGLYRRLAAANPAAFEPDLAAALNNLGRGLPSLGHREQALRATEEAVELYSRLAAANPAAFEPDLARALNNLGIGLSDLGRREQGLQVTEAAIAIYRRLAAANPAAFEPDLARALWGFAWACSADQIQLDQALAHAQEAVDIYARLVRQLAMAYTSSLRGALGTMAEVLDGLGRYDVAAEIRRSHDEPLEDGE